MRSLAALAAMLLACAGCVSLPEDGPVTVRSDTITSDPAAGHPYKPRSPQPGETPGEVVRHFLDAMTANPISTAVAREFLTPSARESWRPQEEMITYADLTTPLGSSQVRVNLLGAHRLDARGSWRGALDEDEAELSFGMKTFDGEWRIDEVPNAMIVSQGWFEERYQHASLFFFDPTGTILVPEPVFVPRGEQMATALVDGLLRGPAHGIKGLNQTFFPDGLSVDFSIPVPSDGLAEVALRGEAPVLDPETIELLTVQLAWTLRQDTSIKRFRITLNGTPITDSGTRTDVDVSVGEPYDPAVRESSEELFGLRDGRLVTVNAVGERQTLGPFGQRDFGLRNFAVDLDGTTVAGVSRDGGSVLTAKVDGSSDPVPVWTGSDLRKPAWDHSGALWLLDRTAQGARILTLYRGEVAEVDVPGVSGKQVIDYLVSRDASRLVAIVAGENGDRAVASRLVRRSGGIQGMATTAIWAEPGERLDLRSLAWRSPTEVLVARVVSDGLTQVAVRSVDGSSALSGGDSRSELIRDQVRYLVSSPLTGQPAWAIGRGALAYLVAFAGEAFLPEPGFDTLTYVG